MKNHSILCLICCFAPSNIASRLSKPLVFIVFFNCGSFVTLSKIIFLMARGDNDGKYDFNKAAAQATCGAAIDVPFNGE